MSLKILLKSSKKLVPNFANDRALTLMSTYEHWKVHVQSSSTITFVKRCLKLPDKIEKRHQYSWSIKFVVLWTSTHFVLKP